MIPFAVYRAIASGPASSPQSVEAKAIARQQVRQAYDVRTAISIVVVTYNSASLMPRLLNTLRKQLATMQAEVIVVDNASHDGTADLVRGQFPDVRLIRSEANLGFAAANNLAAQQARGEFLLFLNPDAIPDEGSIALALQHMQDHPEVGMAGGKLVDEQGHLQPSGRLFPNLWQEFVTLTGLAARFPGSSILGGIDRTWCDPNVDAEVDWVPGAFAIIRRGVFLSLNGFDERFFMYYEEVDLCRRLKAGGLSVHYLPEVSTRHIGGASAKTVEGQQVSKSGSQLTLWRIRSGLMYYRKNHGLLTTYLVHQLEKTWHQLRRLHARLRGNLTKQEDCEQAIGLLERAWCETMGGRVSPPRPW